MQEYKVEMARTDEMEAGGPNITNLSTSIAE